MPRVIRDSELSRQAVFLAMLKQAGLPHPHTEYRFHDTRRWRFDYAWPQHSVALEKQGGIWRRGGGAHTGTGHLRDIEKMNAAQLMGWRVLQCVTEKLCTEETIDMLAKLLSPNAVRAA